MINVVEEYTVTGDLPLVLVDAEKIGMKVHYRSAYVFFVPEHEGLVGCKEQQASGTNLVVGEISIKTYMPFDKKDHRIITEALEMVERVIIAETIDLKRQVTVLGVR